MRLIASRGDVYGPNGGNTVRTVELGGASVDSSTQSPQQSMSVITLFQNLQGSILGQPLTWLFALIGVLVAYKLIEEHRGGQEAFSEIKLGLNNVVKIGLAAMLFFVIARYGASRVNVPGASSLVQYATGGS